MQKKLIALIALLLVTVLFSGCISGEVNATVHADGSMHQLISLDKVGLLAGATCKSLKNMMQMRQDFDVSDLEYFDQVCRETSSAVIVEFDAPYGDQRNPVKIVERADGNYLRYETELSPITTTTITMPSEVTSHNGELINDNTVAFKGAQLQNDSNKVIFVESRMPEPSISMFTIFIIIVVIVLVIVILVLIWSIVFAHPLLKSKGKIKKRGKQ